MYFRFECRRGCAVCVSSLAELLDWRGGPASPLSSPPLPLSRGPGPRARVVDDLDSVLIFHSFVLRRRCLKHRRKRHGIGAQPTVLQSCWLQLAMVCLVQESGVNITQISNVSCSSALFSKGDPGSSVQKMFRYIVKNPIQEIYVFSINLADTYVNE